MKIQCVIDDRFIDIWRPYHDYLVSCFDTLFFYLTRHMLAIVFKVNNMHLLLRYLEFLETQKLYSKKIFKKKNIIHLLSCLCLCWATKYYLNSVCLHTIRNLHPQSCEINIKRRFFVVCTQKHVRSGSNRCTSLNDQKENIKEEECVGEKRKIKNSIVHSFLLRTFWNHATF